MWMTYNSTPLFHLLAPEGCLKCWTDVWRWVGVVTYCTGCQCISGFNFKALVMIFKVLSSLGRGYMKDHIHYSNLPTPNLWYVSEVLLPCLPVRAIHREAKGGIPWNRHMGSLHTLFLVHLTATSCTTRTAGHVYNKLCSALLKRT